MATPLARSSFNPTAAAIRVLGHFQAGAFCPAEMWSQLADVLSKGNARQILDSLPTSLQQEVRDSFNDRPLSFNTLDGHPLQSEIENWCKQGSGALPIQPPDCFGGIVFDDLDRVLIRKPAGGWGGFAWTFAKGTPEPGESAEETALREVLEETGYRCEIVGGTFGVFKSATCWTAYFLMKPVGEPIAFDAETAEMRWVSIDEARSMLAESKTEKGRARDLAALEAAVNAWRRTR